MDPAAMELAAQALAKVATPDKQAALRELDERSRALRDEAKDENAPMPDAASASDDDNEELARAARNVAPRRDGDTAAPDSRSATPAPTLDAPGEGWALQPRRPSVKLQLERLRALHLTEGETGLFPEDYWSNKEDMKLDGRSMVDPWATWRDSDARFLQLERLQRRREVLSELVVSRNVCACKARVVDGDDELVEGARRCDVLSCQRVRCERCLVAKPMAFGASCGGCSPLVVAPQDAEDPGLGDGAPGLLRSMGDLSGLIGALECVLVDDSEAAQKALKRAWQPYRSFLRPPEGVHFFPNEEGRKHARTLLRRLKLWRRLGRRLGMRKRGATHSRVTKFLEKFFAREIAREYKAQDIECRDSCTRPRPNPGKGKCENCALVKKAIEKAIADAQPELEERLEGKGLKRGRDPSEDEVVEEATALLRVMADDEPGSSDDDDSEEEGDSSSSDDEKKKYKRGEGPLVCDHVKYWAIFRVLAGVQSKVFDLSLASTPRSSGPVIGATPTLRGSGTPSRTRGRC
jgi:hypothetical protein